MTPLSEESTRMHLLKAREVFESCCCAKCLELGAQWKRCLEELEREGAQFLEGCISLERFKEFSGEAILASRMYVDHLKTHHQQVKGEAG